ncbi:enoyl-CoA hydratase/isomerase family protein [Pseudonocardia sp. CA-107938]|uniref:enoyl-CoA hydratase/isomerase family protein n=1 Tax=Pseudonocardia sp. CA-107938 TaxID=3240021 RepID=UPI003D9099BC
MTVIQHSDPPNERIVVVERLELPDAQGAQLGLVRLDEPDRLNPLSWAAFRQLHAGLAELEADDAVRVVAITGTGRAFSAGGDLRAYLTLQRDPVALPRYFDDVAEALEMPSSMGKPVIALVNGVAVGGGLELVLSCDFAIAARSARLGDGHANFGQMGGGGALSVLPQVIGLPRAKELTFSGRLLGSAEALAWGLVNRVVEDDELMAAALDFGVEVAGHSPLALAEAKRVMTQNARSAAAAQVERETVMRYLLTSHDAPEGLRAFAEKRRPHFTGR